MTFTPEHTLFRDTVRAFVAAKIAPQLNAWDEAEPFPRALYRRAAHIGLLGLGYPEAYGGTPADGWYRLIATEEIARAGSGGLMASLFSHNIGLPPIVAHGSEALKQRVIPGVLVSEKIAALAITEPSGGSDVARLRCSARLEANSNGAGDHYIIDGDKTFITSGVRADWITLAVRTGIDPNQRGAAGISLIAVPGSTPGITRTPLAQMGGWCSDTAQLPFDHGGVPAEHLHGSRRTSDHAPQAADDAHAHRQHAGLAARADVSSGRWKHRCAVGRRSIGRRPVPAKEPRDANDAVVRRRCGTDPRRHGLYAWHEKRAHLPRGQGDDDRRRRGRNHEGAGGPPARRVTTSNRESTWHASRNSRP